MMLARLHGFGAERAFKRKRPVSPPTLVSDAIVTQQISR